MIFSYIEGITEKLYQSNIYWGIYILIVLGVAVTYYIQKRK